jgi:serine/threonine-protein kinase
MSLQPGARLGSYEIVGLLGAGGMGEVYRARDSKLNRDVAIKVLPDLFANDPERLARFTREAQTLAALNHTNIAHIHGLEESSSVRALVMELVEGDDLSVLIARGPMSLADALPIAKQIADALETAHEQGIVHRDLKPANVKVRTDGTVKVLDFGLAKALGPDGSGASSDAMNSPTLTARATQMGMIIGTAAYMSPEQARGKVVDRRADIWAFGVVFYEMLTGKRAFDGDDISITLAGVLKEDVNWQALPADLPPPMRRLLQRCLEKDPKKRLRDIGEARLTLEDPASLESASTSATTGSTAAATTPPLWRRALPWAVAAAGLGAALVSLLLWAPWRTPAPATPMRLSAEIGVDSSLDISAATAAVISPDGRTMVFLALGNAGRQLFVRKTDQLQATALAGTTNATNPFFAPDSQWIGFFAEGHLKKVSITGGAAVSLCPATGAPRGAFWAEDDTIIFQPGSAPGPLMRVPTSGGTTATPLAALAEGESFQRWPQVLPNGKGVIYSGAAGVGTWESANIMLQPLPSGTPRVLVRGGFHGRYVRSGHLVYMHDGTLFAVPFDLGKLEVDGRPAPALEDVLSNSSTGGAQFSVSDAGTLVFSPGKGSGANRPIVWMDHTGATTPLRSAESDWIGPRFSPNGQTLAVAINDGTQQDIWLYDWARDTPTKFTFDPANDIYPVWTPDGKRIVFASERGSKGVNNLYWQRADGTGEVQRLTESPNNQLPYSFDPKGKVLAFSENSPKTSGDLMILPLDGDEATGWKPGKPTPFLATPANEVSPMISPDGRWMAYMSDEGSSMQVYVRPFSGPGGKRAISTSGIGIYPSWSRTRPELIYQDAATTKFMVAPYTIEGESFQAGKPTVWAPGNFMLQGVSKVYDLHPDGLRVAMSRPPDAGGDKRDKVVFIFNFFDELRRVAPIGK